MYALGAGSSIESLEKENGREAAAAGNNELEQQTGQKHPPRLTPKLLNLQTTVVGIPDPVGDFEDFDEWAPGTAI